MGHQGWVWRQALAVVVAVLLLVLTGCGPTGGGARRDSASPPVAALDLNGTRFQAVQVHGDAPALASFGSHGLVIWFERENGVLTLIADGPINTYDMPVRLSGANITPDPEHGGGSDVGCSRATTACDADAWVVRFVAQPLTYTAGRDVLTLISHTAAVSFRRTRSGAAS